MGLLAILYGIFFPPTQSSITPEGIFLIGYLLLFSLPFVLFLVNGVCTYFWGDAIKDSLLPLFVKTVNSHMNYQKNPKEDFWNTLFITNCLQNGLLQTYDRLDKTEDAITYDIVNERGEKVMELKSLEVETSRVSQNGKNRSRHTNNHFYFSHIRFLNPKFTLKTEIQLKQDFNDSPYLKFFITTIVSIVIFVLILIIFQSSQSQSATLMFDGKTLTFFGATFLGTFFIVGKIINYFHSKNRVQLENIDFEKRFDVYCKDPEEARTFLTPSFMYRILDYINKIDPKRVYTFYFKDDYFYVAYNIKASFKYQYLEISSLKSIEKNLDDYVMFYLEIKEIQSLIQDLKLFYYDKGTFDTQVIKN